VSLEPLVFDARPFQERRPEPFAHIMQAVDSLQPGQPFLLIHTFDPRPLEAVVAARGFAFEAREVARQHWEVLFTPRKGVLSGEVPALDNRGLPPAEAGIRTL
jgi:uncharacterized protein (DUF2249 family)